MYQALKLLSLQWGEEGALAQGVWLSERAIKSPKGVLEVDDTLKADQAWRYALDGVVMLWRGDYHNAKNLLQALGRRLDKKSDRKKEKEDLPIAQRFHLHRQAQAQRARVLNALLLPVSSGYEVAAARAPDVSLVLQQAWGEASFEGQGFVSLRELLGLIGASEWRKKGVDIPALGARIHPFYGVFSPVRGEYVDLVAQAPLPPGVLGAEGLALEIGTGTGVLSALLAKRGIRKVIATEMDERALACARFNIQHLHVDSVVDVRQADLFGGVQADLVLCNPPWLPAKPSSAIEGALYDENSQMLKAYLMGLKNHLKPKGEGWLILSDLAEHLQLRSRQDLQDWIAQAGLQVLGRVDVQPKHGKVFDAQDPLHAARRLEVTSLWRLSGV
jgi:SAM-dependent methyltransferase